MTATTTTTTLASPVPHPSRSRAALVNLLMPFVFHRSHAESHVGLAFGTAGFAAPEVAKEGTRAITSRADVYSVGVGILSKTAQHARWWRRCAPTIRWSAPLRAMRPQAAHAMRTLRMTRASGCGWQTAASGRCGHAWRRSMAAFLKRLRSEKRITNMRLVTIQILVEQRDREQRQKGDQQV